MPSHMHWVFRPLDEWVKNLGQDANERTPRERIMHSLKRFTARECNKLLGRTGTFWQAESYDHCVFDIDELERILDYVEFNPVKAKLVDLPGHWRLSFAKNRQHLRIHRGKALAPLGGF